MTNPLDPANTMSSLSLAKSLASISQDASNVTIRLGIIVQTDAASVRVAVSGSPVLQDAAFVLSPHYIPVIGDTVVLLRYGASWLCIGATSLPPADNLVYNGSFEIAPHPGDPPDGWTLMNVQTDATSSFSVFQAHINIPGFEIDGDWCMTMSFVSPDPTGITLESEWYMYSQPIPVIPGESYSASAYFQAIWNNFTAPLSDLNISLDMGWYANATTTTPLSVSGGLNRSGWVTPDWMKLTSEAQPSGFRVPNNANYMRMHLWHRVTLFQWAPAAIIGSMAWDRVVVRKILNADGSIAVVPSV